MTTYFFRYSIYKNLFSLLILCYVSVGNISGQEVAPEDPCRRGGIDCPDVGPIGPEDPIDPEDPVLPLEDCSRLTYIIDAASVTENTITINWIQLSQVSPPRDEPGSIRTRTQVSPPRDEPGSIRTRTQVSPPRDEPGSIRTPVTIATYTVCYGLKGFTLNSLEELGCYNTTSKNYLFTGLLPNTEYDFYLKKECSGGNIRLFKKTVKTKPGEVSSLPIKIRSGGCNSLETSQEDVYLNTKKTGSYLPKNGDKVYSNASLTTIFNGGNDAYRFKPDLSAEWLYEFEIRTDGTIRNVQLCRAGGTVSTDIDLEAIKSTPGASFRPMYEKKYVVSGWIKEKNTENKAVQKYESSAIRLSTIAIEGGALADAVLIGDFYPKGDIIDGWQRVEEVFIIKTPRNGELTPNNLIIELINTDANSKITSYFDDIRIFPFNASIKSFVYDNNTKKLMAELDENNYATYYEYDNEGGLVRVKKETTRGVFTIQETRSSNFKKYKRN